MNGRKKYGADTDASALHQQLEHSSHQHLEQGASEVRKAHRNFTSHQLHSMTSPCIHTSSS
eukprot:5903163-Pleurochrysis_carterae.AAC.4